MSTIKTVHEAFLHELSDTNGAEHQLSEAMQEMLELATHPDVKAGLKRHIKETKQHIANIDTIFKSFGVKPEEVTCKGAAGIISEFKSGAKEIKEPALLDGFIAAGGLKGEHYEIATYHTLIEQARLMGHADAMDFLQANLAMEEAFAEQLELVGHKLGAELASASPQLLAHPPHELAGTRTAR